MGAVRDLLEALDPPARLDEVDGEIERLRARLEELGEDARARGRRGYRSARKSVPAGARRLKREFGRVEHAAGSTLSERPFQSVFAAFGLGFLVAVLFGLGSRGER